MAKVSWPNIDDELLYFVRNTVTDPQSRGTNDTENVTGTAEQTSFELGTSGVKNVSSVVVGGTAQKFGADYTVNINVSSGTATVTLLVSSGTATDVAIGYHHGQTWVYPDMPRKDIEIISYPRIAILNIDSVMTQISLGTGTMRTSMLKEMRVYGRNENEAKSIANAVKNSVMDTRDGLFNVDLITPVGINRLSKEVGRNDRIVQMSVTVEMPFIFET